MGADGMRKSPPWMMMFLGIWNLAVFATWVIGPFVVAGTVAWLPGWLHLGVLAIALVAHRAYVTRRNPALLERRRKIGEGTKQWDIAWNLLFWSFMASIAMVAALQYHARGSTLPYLAWLV